MYTITHEVILVVEECANCGVLFGITRDFKERLRTKGGNFYCPMGHSLHYGESENDRLKKQLEAETGRAQWWKDEAEEKARSLAATKGALTKAKKRHAAGVCPVCHRQFVGLPRHIESKHPDYDPGTGSGG